MAHIYLDRTRDGRITVRVLNGTPSETTEIFADRAEAEAFAMSRMGRQGVIVSSLDMTPEQIAAAQVAGIERGA